MTNKIKKVIRPLYYFVRIQIILIPNLIRASLIERQYIVKIWLNNFLRILPIYNYLAKLILFLRLRKLVKNSSKNYDLNKLLSNIQIRYINLEHRLDRRKLIENEFAKLKIFTYQRFNAISNKDGAFGCALSHYEVVKAWDTEQFDYLMVIEDDVIFDTNIEHFTNVIESFLSDTNLDILCLGYNTLISVSYDQFFDIATNIQTTSCYIVKKHMRQMLLDNFMISINLMNHKIDKQFGTAIDQVWKILQEKYVFAITKNRLVFQRESFSDIENKIVRYEV